MAHATWVQLVHELGCFIGYVLHLQGMVRPSHRFLSSYISGVPTGYFSHAVPLTSRRGLLLVRLRDQDPSGVLLAVCNPLAGTVHELPRLEHYWDFQQGNEVTGYALLTAADCSSSANNDVSGFFKVLIITINHRQMYYDLHTFSSANESSGRWNTCSGVHGVSAMLRQHDAVVLDCAARWLLCDWFGTYTLDVSAETGHVSFTKLMGVKTYGFDRKYYGKPHLTVNREGSLTVLHLRKDGLLLVSTSHGNGRSFQASMLFLQLPMNGTNHVYTCLGEKDGMMLVKVDNGHVYIADVKTGVTREVLDWPSSNGLIRRKIVPFEIDWSAFFVSRLSV